MKRLISLTLGVFLLTGTATVGPTPLSDGQKQQILLEEWHSALRPPIHPVEPETTAEDFTACETPTPQQREETDIIPEQLRKTIILKGVVSLDTAISEISAAAGMTAVIGRDIDISQGVSLNFENTTVVDALTTILSPLGYSYEVKAGQIHINAFITRTFRIIMPPLKQDYDASITNVSGNTNEESTGLSIGTNITVSTEVRDLSLWQDLKGNVKDLISDKGKYTINKTAGLISVTDYVPVVEDIEKYITFVNKEISKQILIKAKILEVTLSKESAYGINWELVRDRFTLETGFDFQKTSGTPAVFSLPYGLGDIGIEGTSAVINALEGQGKVNIISQPQTLVLNNQPCAIQVGDVNTYVSKLEHTIAETGSETFSVETASFQSGVTMSLIARIIDRNHIFLNICPVVSSLLAIEKAEFGENFVHLPQTNSRSMNSIIKVRGGETIVIGGLILQKKERSRQGLPVLARIPVLKWFFGTTEKRKTASEIVILLTPIVGDTL